MEKDNRAPRYKVVMSHDRQYSLWPAYKRNAPGWDDVGMQGTEVECLCFIKTTWTDLRPANLSGAQDQKMPPSGTT